VRYRKTILAAFARGMDCRRQGQIAGRTKPFVAGGMTTPPSQEDVATRLDVAIATLRTWISRLRQQYRDFLRTEVARTVSDPVEVDEELRYLYRSLMS
jgi:transposase-like protein